MKHDKNETVERRNPPRYAIISLVLFGSSLGALGASAWLAFRSDGDMGVRRGPTALTQETNLGKIWLADPLLEHRLAPNVDVTFTNEDGATVNYRSMPVGTNGTCFRDDGIQGEVFAVAVGDSFTFGHGVPLESTWVERVESGVKADVVNLGITNLFGSTQVLRTLEIHGMPLKPKVIIWAAFVNDWYEDTIFLSWEHIARPLKGQLDFPRSRAVFDSIRRSIYLFPASEPGQEPRNPALDARQLDEKGGMGFQFDATSYAAQDLRLPGIAQGWASTQQGLLRANDLANSIGAKLIVIPIPAKEHVYHDRVCTLLGYAKTQSPETFCKAYETFCSEKGIRCINPLATMQERGRRGEKLFFSIDGHFNVAGNQMLAELILEFLKSEQLIPHSNDKTPK